MSDAGVPPRLGEVHAVKALQRRDVGELCPQRRHEQLIQEQQELRVLTEQQRETTREFRRRSDRLLQDLEKDQRSYEQQIEDRKVRRSGEPVGFIICSG